MKRIKRVIFNFFKCLNVCLSLLSECAQGKVVSVDESSLSKEKIGTKGKLEGIPNAQISLLQPVCWNRNTHSGDTYVWAALLM